MRQGAQGWCTGITHKDGLGWEVGGGFRMGNTCTPMADSCQCMANDTPVCETAKETQMYRTVFCTLGEGEGGMIFERIALKNVYCHM